MAKTGVRQYQVGIKQPRYASGVPGGRPTAVKQPRSRPPLSHYSLYDEGGSGGDEDEEDWDEDEGDDEDEDDDSERDEYVNDFVPAATAAVRKRGRSPRRTHPAGSKSSGSGSGSGSSSGSGSGGSSSSSSSSSSINGTSSSNNSRSSSSGSGSGSGSAAVSQLEGGSWLRMGDIIGLTNDQLIARFVDKYQHRFTHYYYEGYEPDE